MSTYVGEKTLLTTRPTRLISLRWYFLLFLSLALAVLFYFPLVASIPEYVVLGWSTDTIAAIFFLFLAFVSFAVAELRRATIRYIITDNKIIREQGILSKDTQMVPYTQLERVDVRQSLVQRLLRIGTVVVDTGDDTLTIEMVPHPARIQELLSQRLGRRAFIQR